MQKRWVMVVGATCLKTVAALQILARYCSYPQLISLDEHETGNTTTASMSDGILKLHIYGFTCMCLRTFDTLRT